MSDNEVATKVEEHKTEEHHEGDGSEELLSIENLDSIIAAEDPEFAKSIDDIGPDDPNVDINIGDEHLEYKLEDELKYWRQSGGLREKIVKYIPFVAKLFYKFKIAHLNFRLSLRNFKTKSWAFIKSLGPRILASIKKTMKVIGGAISAGLHAFKGYTLVRKLLFVLLIAATGGGGFVLFKVITHKIVPHNEELFVGSLDEWAEAKYLYEENEVESFYESTRTQQNIIIINKMIANIRRSAGSGDNPMGAFEFFVEGTDSDSVVEIKDREAEVRDLFLRTISDMNYDELSSGEGKQLLNEKLKKEINKILTTGKVRRIFIKTVVLKP